MGEPWICVDGVDGVGKTTITGALAAALSISAAPEFSSAPFGQALKSAVRSSPHYISTSPAGQSLVFLGDFFEVYSSAVAPRVRDGEPVISDRGYLSKYAYQEVVLSSRYEPAAARRLLDAVFAFLPPPALTIYLTAPVDVLVDRLIRRDGSCDDSRREFLVQADRAARARLRREPILPSMILDTNRPVAELLAEIEPVVRWTIRRS
ncbi:hypothetical protein [Actinocrispum sp. NPDC049592]|uniref:hypothetical protein n=1 Tax=Actinocrispum sp. NPDC049592 TaxID=3154835 RepID=UPI0034478AE1